MAIEKENIIVRMFFGSRLYGTDTEDSDMDYKGVFMPTKSEILLGKIPKGHNSTTKQGTARNTSTDIDEELYSLHYFIELACQGQTVALDMLHANKESIITSSPVWENIVLERERFYAKDLKAFVGYAHKQANRYGLRGGRVNTVNEVIKVLESAS